MADYVKVAQKYARDVVAGRIPACKWVRLACARQIADLKRAKVDKSWPYVFDNTAAERVCRFVENMPHIKGDLAKQGLNIKLEPWQVFILTTVFGWLHRVTGFRRFRTAYMEEPRKNAKSTISSGVGLYMLSADGEHGAECYSAATKKDQARIVFDVARSMARKAAGFRDHFGVEVSAHNIHMASTESFFRALDAEGDTQDGLNIHFGCIDELHAHKKRTLFDVLESATGSRKQSLLWSITTAGTDLSGICYEQRNYVTKVLEGVFEDDTYFGIIFTIDEDDDWKDQAAWAKANPNLGVSVFEDDIVRQCKKAQQSPASKNTFLTKRLNVWTRADTAWMDMAEWNACADTTLRIDDFIGEECIGGVDLASKIDIAAAGNMFERNIDGKKHYYAFGRYYLPKATIENAANSQYEGWEQAGHLIATEGNITDIDEIEADIIADAGRFQVREWAYDPFQATQMATHLLAENIEMVEVGATVRNFSEPMKELAAIVKDGRFHHDGNPALTWMVSNVVCHTDKKDNIYPNKDRDEYKIDGAIVLIMQLGRLIVADDDGPSVYEQEGVII